MVGRPVVLNGEALCNGEEMHEGFSMLASVRMGREGLGAMLEGLEDGCAAAVW